MRILMVTDFYRPYVGGVEQHVRSLAHALVDRGHDVAVATLRTPRAGPVEETDGAVRVHRLRSVGAARLGSYTAAERPWAPPIVDPLVLAGLRRVVARERPDVVHGHDWLARSAWPLCLGGRPLVLSLHYYTRSCAKKSRWDGDGPCAGPSAARCVRCACAHYGPAKGIATLAANRVGAAVDDRVARRVIAVSEATALGNGLPPSVRGRTAVVPNLLASPARDAAVDAAVDRPADLAADPVADQPADRPGRGAPADLPDLPDLPEEPFLLYVGDLRREKGLEVLLDAYARLRRDAPSPVPPLVVLGERHGRRTDDLPPGVVAIGPVDNDAVLAAWARCLFGVVPSVWAEPFGIVVIEAMAAGRTLVASDVGGIGEIVTDGETGLLVAPGDADGLARAMRRLLDDRVLRARLERGAAQAVARYAPARVAAEVEAVYLDALATAPRGWRSRAGS